MIHAKFDKDWTIEISDATWAIMGNSSVGTHIKDASFFRKEIT